MTKPIKLGKVTDLKTAVAAIDGNTGIHMFLGHIGIDHEAGRMSVTPGETTMFILSQHDLPTMICADTDEGMLIMKSGPAEVEKDIMTVTAALLWQCDVDTYRRLQSIDSTDVSFGAEKDLLTNDVATDMLSVLFEAAAETETLEIGNEALTLMQSPVLEAIITKQQQPAFLNIGAIFNAVDANRLPGYYGEDLLSTSIAYFGIDANDQTVLIGEAFAGGIELQVTEEITIGTDDYRLTLTKSRIMAISESTGIVLAALSDKDDIITLQPLKSSLKDGTLTISYDDELEAESFDIDDDIKAALATVRTLPIADLSIEGHDVTSLTDSVAGTGEHQSDDVDQMKTGTEG